MDTTVSYGGLKLKNPLIVASGGISGDADLICEAEDSGAAAVVMKTLFEEEYARKNPAPCFSFIKRKSGPQTATTFYTFEQASSFNPERYAEEVKKAREKVKIPVIASINCVSENAWIEYAKLLENNGASAIEINRSCPYSTVATSGKEMWTTLASETLKSVKKAVKIPVYLKMTPQISDPCGTALALEQSGADALVMFSRFTGLEIDLKTEKPVMHGGLAGHGGLWSIHYALRWISATYPNLQIPISGSGGVGCGEDVIKFILSGATTVQICTAVYMEGFKVFPKYLETLKNFMKEKGYKSLDDFRGKITDKIIPTPLIKRGGSASAIIAQENCSRCALCETVCLHKAIDYGNDKYSVNEKCAGCGLCQQICPKKCIRII